jgi:N-acetylornithine carbamoyltransferase
MTAMRHCYSLDDFSREELDTLLDRAELLRGVKLSQALAGKSVILMFLASSLRTRVSMELAAQQLGAHVVQIQADGGLWKMEYQDGVEMRGGTAEHIREAVRVLGRYGDLLAVRAFPSRKSWEADAQDPVLNAFIQHGGRPVLNLESCLYHPCQALADLLTIRNDSGGKPGKIVLTWADHPRALPVAVPNSFALAVTQMGWDLTVTHPDGYDLPKEVTNRCAQYAAQAGSRFDVTPDREAAFDDATYVYAKSWGRLDYYGRDDEEIAQRQERGLQRWIVDEDIMARTDNAGFLHCLPVRRNVVVSDSVIDGARSLVIDEAENRLHVQKALLMELLGGKIES